MNDKRLAKYIDYSILLPYSSKVSIVKGCEKAKKYGVASLIVLPWAIKIIANELSGSEVAVGAAISFPFGCSSKKVKIYEAVAALEDGAKELDVVMNLGAFKSGDYQYVLSEFKEIVKNVKGAVVKFIIEVCYLSKEEKIKACQLVEQSGADFVKTSTGFAGPPTEEDIKLLYDISGKNIKVKAAGGMRIREKAISMINCGACRLGISHLENILKSN